ncbi:MAG: metalloregulator ArsR/SmtB family transcription factor [Alphaproteobacteria bacterium]
MKQKTAVTLLSALAQDTRLTIFRELVKAHNQDDPSKAGLAVSALNEKLNVSPPTLSFHLKEMTNAGLITPNRQGRSIIYTADVTAMQGLIEYLLEDCCGGTC